MSPQINKLVQRFFKNNYSENCLFLSCDDNNKIREYELIVGYNKSSIELPISKIMEIVDKFQYKKILVIHNHPQGSYLFSQGDKETFSIWKSFEKQMNCEFLDLLIVTPRLDYYTALSDPFEQFKLLPLQIEVSFTETASGINKYLIKILSPIKKEEISKYTISRLISVDIKENILKEFENLTNVEIFYKEGENKVQWK